MSGLADRVRAVVGGYSGIGAPQPASAPAAPASAPPCDLSPLGGTWRDGVFVVERRYERTARHGRETVGAIGDRIAAAVSHAALFAGPSRPPAEETRAAVPQAPFVFFDLETTGLSGGAGTQAFLVGCGCFDDDGGFAIRQFVLTSPRDEERLLGGVQGMLRRAGALVSFNGKSFDAPMLETRYLFHRLPWRGRQMPHIDVLHAARRFWGAGSRGQVAAPRGSVLRGESDCSLATLERHVLGAHRRGDVPGVEIPARYFQFVRSGDAGPLAAVCEHNRLDLLTLAALLSRLVHLARVGPAETTNAREALALGHVFARGGLEAQARAAFERSLTLCASPASAYDATRIDALRALAFAWRRARQFDRAADCWTGLLQVRGCPPSIAREATEALAIHHEHRRRDLAAARTFALRGLDVGLEPPARSAAWMRAVQHRLARIDRKLGVSAPPSLLS